MSQTSYPCLPRLLRRQFEHMEAVRRREDEHERKFPSKAQKQAKLQAEMKQQSQQQEK